LPRNTIDESTKSDDDFIDDGNTIEINQDALRNETDTAPAFVVNTPHCKPLYILSTWRDPRTRDGRISIVLVLPSGVLQMEGGVVAEVVSERKVKVTITWPTPATDVQKIVSGILAVDSNLDLSHGTLMAQGFHDFLSQYRAKEADPIVSTCLIELPFPVKPDFDEEAIMFNDSETQLYLLQLRAPEKRYSTPSKRLRINRVESHAATSEISSYK